MIKKIGNFTSLLVLLMSLSVNSAFGLEASIEVSPEQPLVGENFNLIFKIKSSTNSVNETPVISFDPDDAEVLGKSTENSIRTIIINGKVIPSNEIAIVYDMMINKAKKLNITDIKIEHGSESVKLKDFQINVVSEEKREKNKDVFLMAVASKKKVYVGEGFNVDYYLYYRVPVGQQEIVEFPKLNNFTKRFQSPNDQGERVIYNGEAYVRAKRYSARLFPTTPGVQFVDSIKLKVQYSTTDQVSPFFGFGLSARQYRSINLQSKKLEIEVMPIPIAGRPQSFTGLVGKHQVNLNISENKFLVNQPIEFGLEISGEGMLEGLEAPIILEDSNLESFDIKSDFEEQGMVLARKKFEYTFLPRGPFKSAEKSLEIAIFNPDSNKFEIIRVKVPEILVEGEMSKTLPMENTKVDGNLEVKKAGSDTAAASPVSSPTELLPLFSESQELFVYDLNFLHKIFVVVSVALIFSLFPFSGFQKPFEGSELSKAFLEIYKEGPNYSRLYSIFSHIAEKRRVKDLGFQDTKAIIKDLDLSDNAKNYFCTLVDKLEKLNFEESVKPVEVKLEKKYFKELEKLTRKIL